MKHLITGGAGFIGSHLVERLLRDGHEVMVLDNLFTGRRENVPEGAQFVFGDVCEPFHFEVDRIYHLACPASPVHYQRNAVRTIETAVIGTRNALACARDVGASIVIASTSEVYGDGRRLFRGAATMNFIELAGPLGPFRIPAEPPETRRICEALTKGVWEGEYDHPELTGDIRHVVDVGSGWGAFAVWARSRFGVDIEIDCYDPHELGCRFAIANVVQNAFDHAGVGRANVHNVAVTTNPAPRFWPGEDWGAQKTIDMPPQFGVPVDALHPRDLPPCDLLKIDAEGVEAEVLEHYAHWSTLRAIAYEWHTPELKSKCREIVERRGGMRLLVERGGPGYGVSIWKREELP